MQVIRKKLMAHMLAGVSVFAFPGGVFGSEEESILQVSSDEEGAPQNQQTLRSEPSGKAPQDAEIEEEEEEKDFEEDQDQQEPSKLPSMALSQEPDWFPWEEKDQKNPYVKWLPQRPQREHSLDQETSADQEKGHSEKYLVKTESSSEGSDTFPNQECEQVTHGKKQIRTHPRNLLSDSPSSDGEDEVKSGLHSLQSDSTSKVSSTRSQKERKIKKNPNEPEFFLETNVQLEERKQRPSSPMQQTDQNEYVLSQSSSNRKKLDISLNLSTNPLTSSAHNTERKVRQKEEVNRKAGFLQRAQRSMHSSQVSSHSRSLKPSDSSWKQKDVGGIPHQSPLTKEESAQVRKNEKKTSPTKKEAW